MRTEDELWWLDLPEIIGFEDDDDDSGDDDADDDADDDEESSDDDNDDDSSDDDDDDSDDDDEDKTAGLKSALRKERQLRRALEKENRQLKKGSTKPKAKAKEDEDSDDSSSNSEEDQVAQARQEKLAGKLLNNAINTEIIKVAGGSFKDIDDVLALINRELIDADQDDDDPSEVTIDAESVKDAVKALAKKKPHLLAGGTGGPKSGSKFGGSRKSKDGMTEEQLLEKYPALRR